jgi:hypothetical protein
MNGVLNVASAMLAIAFAVVMLVAGQWYIAHRPASFTPAALVTSVSWGKPYANLPH